MQRFSSLSSTNDHAAQLLLSQPLSEGTVILADHQTAGRGQMGNTWEVSAGKNLTLSVVLHPKFLAVRQQFDLNKAVALAVRDAVASFIDKDVKIKWPNDILIEERKTCGILIQNTLSGAYLQSSIIGIGLNVNQKQFAPQLTRAVSMSLAADTDFDLEEVMWALLQALEARYLQLRRGEQETLHRAYLSQLFRFGVQHTYGLADGNAFLGKIVGIDQTGKLMVETQTGITLFGIKEIQYVY